MNRNIRPIILLLASAYFSSCGGNRATAPAANGAASSLSIPTENVEQTLIQMEHDWAAAAMKNDPAGYERIEADDFIGVDNLGKVYTKADDIAALKTAGIHNDYFGVDDTKVRVFGDAAVVTGHYSIKGRDNSNKPFDEEIRFTNTYLKRQGQWQVVASQLTPMDAGAGQAGPIRHPPPPPPPPPPDHGGKPPEKPPTAPPGAPGPHSPLPPNRPGPSNN